MARNPHASYEASDHQRMPIIPIANNLTTTVSGYALDARQGKVLNDKIENDPGLAWKSILNQTNQITKSALVSLPLGVHIVQVASAPSDFPIGNAYGILYHAGSLLNYHWIVFINSNNMFTINCNGTSIGDWKIYTPEGLSYYCEAYYSASPGANVTVTDVLKFNYTNHNVGNCYSTSTGYFTCPVNGLYTASFAFFSNNTSVNQRPCLYFGGKQIMVNGPYGHTISGTCYCTAGTQIYVKPQSSTYSFTFFGYSGHNLFTVALLRQI